MKRRKSKLTKSKRKKVSVPKSDDSGVSSGLEMPKIDEKEEKTTENNLKISINLENIQRLIKKGNLSNSNESTGVKVGSERSSTAPILDGSQSDKSRFSFEDDAQSCLDYEPYEEEIEDYIDSPDNSKSPSKPEDTTLLQDSYNQNNTGDTDYNTKFYLGYDNGVDIIKNSQDNTSNNNYVDIINESRMNLCGERSSANGCPEIDNLHSNSEEETADDQSVNNTAPCWDEDRNDHVPNCSKGNEYIQDEESEDEIEGESPICDYNKNRAGVFKNAEVNFSGLLNITITRPVINNIESLNSNPTNCVTNDETISSVGIQQNPTPPSNTVIANSTLCSPVTDNSIIISHGVHSENSNRRIKWFENKLDLGIVKVTSEDDIFNYNIRGDLDYTHLLHTFSSNHSEVSCLTDPNLKESEIDKEIEYNCPFDVSSGRISDDYHYNSSTNSFHSPNMVVETSQLRDSDTSITFENPSHVNARTYDGQINTFSRKNLSLKQTESANNDNLSSGSREGVFRHPLKRPPTRPQRKSIDVHDPGEDDALSILGTSTILEVSSNISEASESNTVNQENDKKEFVNRWLITSEANVNQMLESLCESHFTSICDNTRCEKSHFIDEKRMKQLSPMKLNELYELAKKSILWFTHLFDVFLDCFKVSSENGRLCLVDMINDVFVVFKGTFIDKTSYISKIVCALQSTALSFKEAIEYIILRYGTSQISICDILLFIISKESHLDDHWCLVQKMICCRREKLDHDVVINFLHSSLAIYPPNTDLCKKIYYEIFEKKLVDCHKISDSLWVPFRMAIKSHNILGSRAINSKINDTNNRSYSLLNRSSTLQTTCFNSYDEHNNRVGRSIDVFELDQNRVSNSASSDNCSVELSEFNKSLQRMKYNENTMYSRDQNGDMLHLYPDDYQVVRPLVIKPVTMRELSHVQTQDDFIVNNNTKISDNTRHQRLNDHFINNVQNTDLFNSNNKYRYKQDKNSDQDVFKIPNNKFLKKQTRAPTAKNVIHQSYREYPAKARTHTKTVYNNEVLNKINKSLNLCRRPSTPGSSIAHPSSQTNINSRYECNVSLHNLYPDVQINATEITKNELLQLREALQKDDGLKFLSILETYQNAFTIENFILNTLILIKTPTNTLDVFKKFMSLLSAIEDADESSLKIPHVKMVVEVLAMNLIYFLERKGEWGLCRNILLRIKMNNWHSLVTSKIFFCTSHLMSHMCRYIYISEILTRAGDFHWVNEIFQLNNLCLLGPISQWPHQNVASDLLLRNQVLELFFEEGFIVNIVAINDLLNHINIVYEGCIEGFDIWKLFDDKLSLLLDSREEHKSILQYLSPHMANYGRFVSKNVLHGYMLFLKDLIPDKESFKLFKICCDKGVYHKYTGNERVIIIRTIMCDFEISSILECFFENILKRCIYPHDFCIELKLPEPDQPSTPQILKNRNRSIFAVYASITNILKLKYNIIVQQAIESSILVKESMQHLLPYI